MLLQSLLGIWLLSIPVCSNMTISCSLGKDAAERSAAPIMGLTEAPQVLESQDEIFTGMEDIHMSGPEEENQSSTVSESKTSHEDDILNTPDSSNKIKRETNADYAGSLTRHHKEIMDTLKFLIKYRVKPEYKEDLEKAIKKVEEVEMMISIIKYRMSIELTDKKPVEGIRKQTNSLIELLSSDLDKHLKDMIVDLPHDIHTMMYEASKNSLAELLIQNMQELITDYILPLKKTALEKESDSMFSKYWIYFFDVLQFLSFNELINKENFKSIHQDFQAVTEYIKWVKYELKSNHKEDFDGLFKFTQKTPSCWEYCLYYDSEKVAIDRLNLVSLMGEIDDYARYLSGENKGYKQLSSYLSEGKYFSKLKYVLGSNKSTSPELSDANEFKREIEEILTLIMELPQMKSNNHKSEQKEDLQIAICYLLSFIEEDIYPDIFQEMIHLVPFLNKKDETSKELHIEQSHDILKMVYLTLNYDLIIYDLIFWSESSGTREITKYGKIVYSIAEKSGHHLLKNYRKTYSSILKRDPQATFISQRIEKKIQHILNEGERSLEELLEA